MLNLKKLLTQILDKLVVKRYTTETSYGTAYLKKQGNVIILTFVGKSVSYSASIWTTLCTLQYAPETQINFLAYDNCTNNQSIITVPVRIETDGTVRAWAYTAGTKQIYGSIAFITP